MATNRILLVIAFALGVNSIRVLGSNFITFSKYNYERRNGARAVIAAAQKEIGVQEYMENSSPRIDQFNSYVGFKKVAWCASFCCWCFGQAGYKEPKTAWCPSIFPKERVVKEPLPGMIMGIYFPEKGRIAHVGIVVSVKGEWCETVEGNTNVAGSREGDRVMKKLRHKRTIAKYANWL